MIESKVLVDFTATEYRTLPITQYCGCHVRRGLLVSLNSEDGSVLLYYEEEPDIIITSFQCANVKHLSWIYRIP